jgi:hypothetical protein
VDRLERLAALERVLLGLEEPATEGGSNATELDHMRSVHTDFDIFNHLGYALGMGYPEFMGPVPAHDRVLSIAGSSPSLKNTWTKLTGDIWACNDAGWGLLDRGVVPKYVMTWDPQPIVVDCLRRTHPDTTYLICSICHPSVFDLLKERNCNVMIWHPNMLDVLPMYDWLAHYGAKSRQLVGYPIVIPEYNNDECGHSTSAAVTRSMQFAPLMGYRDLRLFGVDSSCEDGVVHFEDLEIDRGQHLQRGTIYGKTFVSTPQMNRQTREFEPLMQTLLAQGVKVKVYGPWSAAIPWIAVMRGWHENSV